MDRGEEASACVLVVTRCVAEPFDYMWACFGPLIVFCILRACGRCVSVVLWGKIQSKSSAQYARSAMISPRPICPGDRGSCVIMRM